MRYRIATAACQEVLAWTLCIASFSPPLLTGLALALAPYASYVCARQGWRHGVHREPSLLGVNSEL